MGEVAAGVAQQHHIMQRYAGSQQAPQQVAHVRPALDRLPSLASTTGCDAARALLLLLDWDCQAGWE